MEMGQGQVSGQGLGVKEPLCCSESLNLTLKAIWGSLKECNRSNHQKYL